MTTTTTALRVLITGSRTWGRPDLVWKALDQLAACRPVTLTVVHGAAPRGADQHASAWVASRREQGYPVVEEAHPADWRREGRAAGFRRNARMVATGPDLCLTFIAPCTDPRCRRPEPHGTHGAVHCATAARDTGIPVHHIRP
jgi:YspA, cpYpsA-related SLOG family